MPHSGARAPATIVSVVSAASGTGRTSAVVNTGWILASAGKRVLIADLDAQQPNAVDYLRPFHVEDVPAVELLDPDRAGRFGTMGILWGLSQTPAPPLGAGLDVKRYRLPGGAVSLDLVQLPRQAPAPGDGVRAGSAIVEMPYRQYGFDAALAVLADEPTDRSGLLAAYERLAREITDGAVDGLAAMPTGVRARYRRGLGLDPVEEPETAIMVYAP